ncbi:FAD-dependent monooxygenase [Phanerochaete sordida]|uniref:FAD-dependent monooxygenase n=1 Tax=Phanerochaete sordida TaxID=48140 RepID=A0A9P3GNI9_9APHY|nr:FAD-dependent monooxygenase [Phanerochaete sordida]
MADRIRLAIVGGGIYGLTFAIALAKSGAPVDVDIYESAKAFSEIGAGMAFLPRVWEAMRILGLDEELRAKSSAGTPFRFSKGDQNDFIMFGQSGANMDSYHRAEFLATLVQHLPSHFRTHFGKRLMSYTDEPPAPVQSHFKDGTTAECDVLIGADGVKSAVRRVLFEQLAACTKDPAEAERLRACVPAKWTGQYVYRGLVPRAQLEQACPGHPALSGAIYFMGKDKYLICYPVSQGTMINVGGIVTRPDAFGTLHPEPWVLPVTQDEFRAQYAGWSPYVHHVIDAIKTPSKWATNSVLDLPTYASGRVAIIGDAAHAMTPHLASGAGQGVEDGLVLAALLASPHARRETLPQVLHAYDAVRRPFSQDILQRSYDLGSMFCLQTPRVARADVSLEDLQLLSADIADISRWTWTTTAERERTAAVKMLGELVAAE